MKCNSCLRIIKNPNEYEKLIEICNECQDKMDKHIEGGEDGKL